MQTALEHVYGVLLTESSGEPDARYVLFRLMLDAVLPRSAEKTTDIARAYGMPEDRLRRAIGHLQEDGFVLLNEFRVQEKGRPRKRIALTKSPELRRASEEIALAPSYSAIRWLAAQQGRRSIPKVEIRAKTKSELLEVVRALHDSTRLSRSNALIIFLMLMSSDEFGVVQGLSTASLAGLAGFTPAQLKQRLKRLMMQGVIRCSVPGGYSRLLKGRVPSVYMVNLLHEAVRGEVPKVSYESLSPAPYLSVRAIKHPAHAMKHTDFVLAPGGGFYWALRAWPAEATLVCRMVQLLICSCANEVLAKGWKSLTERSELVEDAVRRLIAEHFDVALSLKTERWAKLLGTTENGKPVIGPPSLEQPEEAKQVEGYVYSISSSSGIDGALYLLTLELLRYLAPSQEVKAIQPAFRVWLEEGETPQIVRVQLLAK